MNSPTSGPSQSPTPDPLACSQRRQHSHQPQTCQKPSTQTAAKHSSHNLYSVTCNGFSELKRTIIPSHKFPQLANQVTTKFWPRKAPMQKHHQHNTKPGNQLAVSVTKPRKCFLKSTTPTTPPEKIGHQTSTLCAVCLQQQTQRLISKTEEACDGCYVSLVIGNPVSLRAEISCALYPALLNRKSHWGMDPNVNSLSFPLHCRDSQNVMK